MSFKTDIAIPKVFIGPRHDRLRAIWDTIADYAKDDIRLQWIENRGCHLSHADCFNLAWDRNYLAPGIYLLLTEADFLPDLRQQPKVWTGRTYLGDYDALGVEYCTRTAGTYVLNRKGVPGGWFILLNKPLCPSELDFHGTPDPGNQLAEKLNIKLLKGCDAYPQHHGIKYARIGDHLFWSRHLHDDPKRTVSGFLLEKIQATHDRFVTHWISKMPAAFTELLATNYGKDILYGP